jgi:hypothetical protein
MTKHQTNHFIKEILAITDEEGKNLFDSVALIRKPQSRRGQRFAISVRDVRSGHTLRLSTRHEVALFIKQQKKRRGKTSRRPSQRK